MSNRTIQLTDELLDYLRDSTLRESDVFRRLRDETSRLENAGTQIAPEQGQFMSRLCELVGVRRAIELGTFT
ncbi:MAG: hypothetical protein P8Y53_24860, partial [Pseudolabrys sp.]